jgi:hypothetical protein
MPNSSCRPTNVAVVTSQTRGPSWLNRCRASRVARGLGRRIRDDLADLGQGERPGMPGKVRHTHSVPLIDGRQALRPTGLASISVGYAWRQLNRQSCGRAAGIR